MAAPSLELTIEIVGLSRIRAVDLPAITKSFDALRSALLAAGVEVRGEGLVMRDFRDV